MKFICKTFFDITATGVTGHYKSSRVPFNDLSNVTIEDERSWNYARNQQRNWETITQLIGLRTQISQIENPTKVKNLWNYFSFIFWGILFLDFDAFIELFSLFDL
jgi:hypothetical protein